MGHALRTDCYGWARGPRRYFQREPRSQATSKAQIRLLPVEGQTGNKAAGFRSLAKPLLFAVGCTGVSFAGAIIWQYEEMRLDAQAFLESRRIRASFHETKYGEFRRQINTWWNRLGDGHRMAYSIIAVNVAVFLLWRVPRLQPTMIRYFSSHPASKSVCLPMLLSTFSHYSLFHLCANMIVLNSFAPGAVALLGKEQFLAMYLSGGVLSSFTSYVHKILLGRGAMSLGASGAILSVIAAMCVQYPDAQLAIIFLPFFTFSAGMALKAVLALDTAGVVFGWQLLDHAAHLGGSLFGIGYILYGREMWKKREGLMKVWHDLRYPKRG
ncbi:presenilin-associated rhomboid-like protein, mitochondrial isoform X2 [Ornithodoros turicata]|uniref:presenilin-associated rhomboid-like protein, mitochondrial isoform X2 n=1 Tax=Ornithodoros turicata TaxID=34597 RepID=UPI0031394339